MRETARNPVLLSAIIVLISLVTVFFRLGSLPLIGSDEPRYARIAQEMMQGHRWVTPTLEYKPWLEKPPLYYWITIPFFATFGMTEASARLGPALLGLVSALAILRLGMKLWSRLAGFLGAAILLTALGYIGFARGASTDMPMTACLTVALAILAEAAVGQRAGAWKVLVSYVFLGLSVLAKGPVAIVLVAGILLLFWLFDDRGGSLRQWHLVSGTAVTAVVAVPWFWLAFRENGFAFIATFFINHNLARYVSNIHHHTEPFYYYLPVVLGMFLPWSPWLLLLVPDSLSACLRRWRNWNPATLFLFCWIVFPFLFFSFSDSKLSGYVLPILPPLALLLGAGWAKAIGGEIRTRMSIGAPWLYLLSAAGIAVAAPVLFQKSYGDAWKVGLLLSAAAISPALLGFYFGIKRRWLAAFAATLAEGLILVLAIVQFAFPVIGDYQSAREIARQALAHEKGDEPIATFLFFHHALNYYTGYRITEDCTDPGSLLRLASSYRRILVVMEAEHVSEVECLPGLSVKLLGTQGKLRLLELSH